MLYFSRDRIGPNLQGKAPHRAGRERYFLCGVPSSGDRVGDFLGDIHGFRQSVVENQCLKGHGLIPYRRSERPVGLLVIGEVCFKSCDDVSGHGLLACDSVCGRKHPGGLTGKGLAFLQPVHGPAFRLPVKRQSVEPVSLHKIPETFIVGITVVLHVPLLES